MLPKTLVLGMTFAKPYLAVLKDEFRDQVVVAHAFNPNVGEAGACKRKFLSRLVPQLFSIGETHRGLY